MDNSLVALGEGRRRQLPPWMLGKAASANPVPDQSRKSEEMRGVNADKEKIELEEEVTKVKPCSLATCETRRKRGRSTRVDAEVTTHGKAALVEKDKVKAGGRKSRESAPKMWQQGKRSRCKSSEKIVIPSPGEEDGGELTVEDLMSIAQEYVGSEKHMEEPEEHPPLPHGEQETENQLPAIALRGNESGGCSNAPLSNTMYKEMVHVDKSTESLASEIPIVNPPRTGDPTQDMLNLFLGPLLNKPSQLEKNTEFARQDISYSYETKTQRQSNIAAEELVPLMKKKSSLKDKVAMFLD